MIDVAICVPVRHTVDTHFAYCLSMLVSRLSSNNVNHKLFFQIGSILPDQRTQLVNTAIASANPTHILWLDSDMTFPPTVYEELLNKNENIVACTYSTRTAPYKSVAFVDLDNTDKRLDEKSGSHYVAAVGMGIMLVSTDVFKKIPAPWFIFEWSNEFKSFTGEDIYFCKLANEYDYKILVDLDISQKCGHVASIIKMIGDVDEKISI
jgi:hypothetical protein